MEIEEFGSMHIIVSHLEVISYIDFDSIILISCKFFIFYELVSKACTLKPFLENAQSIWEKINPENAKNIDIKAEANFTHCQLLIAQKKYQEALADLDKLYFNNYQKNKINYLKGLIFQNTNDQAKAEKYFKNAHLSSPYSPDVLLNSAYFFQEFKRDSLQAYNILVNGVRGNAFSIPLFKAYSLQALRAGFYQFGDTALDDLRANLKDEDFVIFEKFYKNQKDSIRKARGFEN